MKSKSQKKPQRHKLKIKKNLYAEVLNKKAGSYTYTLKWGRGSTEKVKKMLIEALDKPCYWCGKKLTLDNIQLDHKKPMLRTVDIIEGIQSPPINDFIMLNRPQNLRFICKMCNLTKGTLPENEFKKLNDFLNKNKKIRGYVRNALYHYGIKYSILNRLI